MEQTVERTTALLARTPAALDALLRGLPEDWALANEGGETWRPYDVVGHLAYGERSDWMPRVRMIVEHGEGKTFERFNRLGQVEMSRGKTLDELLDAFAEARAVSLEELRGMNLQPADMERKGRHPAFGEVTLSQLLAAWVVHDMTHLHQLSRAMAHQYREATGPWVAYLGVLQCSGHSAP